MLPEDLCKEDPLQFQCEVAHVESWQTHVQLLASFGQAGFCTPSCKRITAPNRPGQIFAHGVAHLLINFSSILRQHHIPLDIAGVFIEVF